MINDYNNIELGKLVDTGDIVKGGRIDRHWQTPEVENYYKKLFDKEPNHRYLFDPKETVNHFDLKSVEFGNWMSQQDRANFLYATAFALDHLAVILEVKEKQIGLGGQLSVALGARGMGGRAAAHYEPYRRTVINVAKTERNGETLPKGQGSVAHEFAHAFDNILSKGLKLKQTYLSGGRSVRKGVDDDLLKNGNVMEKHFERLFKVLYWEKGKPTKFHKDLDATKSDYLNRRNEVWARTIEAYVRMLLDKKKIKDNFLVDANYKHPVYPSQELLKKAAPHIEKILKGGFKIIGKAGLSGVAVGVSGYAGFRKTIKENGDLDDTLGHMKHMALRDMNQVHALARLLKGNNTEATCRNIWNYLRENTRYKKDKDGIEELRTPARSVHDGRMGLSDSRYGIDCDDYTILVSSILLNLGIPHEYRVAAYNNKGEFQHIYPVAFDGDGVDYIIDIVPEIPRFNYEAQPIIDLKIVNMEIHELSGLGSGDQTEEKQRLLEEFSEPFTLDGLDEDLDDEILESNFLAGFEEVDTEEEADIVLAGSEVLDLVEKGILSEVAKAKKALMDEMANPTVLSQTIDVANETAIMDDLIRSWDEPEERRDILLEAIKEKSPYRNFYKSILFSLDKLEDDSELNGFEDIYLARVSMEDGEELLDEFDEEFGLDGTELEEYEDEYEEGEESELGLLRRNPKRRAKRAIRRRRRKGRVKKLFKKVGNVLKKGVKAVVRYNPATITARNAALATLKSNAGGVSAKLIYGYLSESQARAKGLDVAEWRKLKKAVQLAEKYFKKIGGKPKNFRNAIVKGRARRKTGIQLGAAAVGIAAFVANLLKKINIGKLFKGKDPEEMGVDEGTDPADSNLPIPGGDDLQEVDSYENYGDDDEENKVMAFLKQTWVKWTGIGLIALILVIVIAKMVKRRGDKKKRQLSGMKAAQTRAINKAIEEERKRHRSRGRKRSTPKRKSNNGRRTRGNSTSRRKSTSKRGGKISNGNRFKEMHRIAKGMRKKHPNTKYSVLLGKAAKQIK